MKSSQEIRKAFFDFWTSEPRNAAIIPNLSLVPNVDSTLLFVNSGMFPLAPYLAGEPHPMGKRLVNFQRCLRTNYDEMVEIGDNRHTLMFEMMGNWSLGDFTKEQQIPWIMEFYIEKCGLDPKRMYVSVFGGNDLVGRDDVAIEAWKKAYRKYGIEAEFSEDISNLPANIEEGNDFKFRIFPYGKKKNWWQRADAPGELGGPSSEIFYDRGVIDVEQDQYHINDDSGRFIEIGNNVFMEYKLDSEMNWEALVNKNIDFGGGFERIVMFVQNKSDIFEIDIYEPILKKITEISGKEYKTSGKDNEYTAAFRVLADHSRAATFIMGDGIAPSNKDQGYILRRFIRRLVRFGMKLDIQTNFTKQLAEAVVQSLKDVYPQLEENKQFILDEIDKEETKFRRTLEKGLKEINKIIEKGTKIDGKTAFFIYETYGFPLELIFDELGVDEDTAKAMEEDFKTEVQKHRDQSRSGAEQKFKGGLADQSELTTRLHTAHHLLLAALQQVLGHHVHQKGSNITAERLRIDFSHADKMTPDQISEVEDIVNEKIEQGWKVLKKVLPREVAEGLGAEMEFGAKYGDLVNVYMIVEPDLNDDAWPIPHDKIFSKEFCGGPHVANTSELSQSGKFKIIKEENIGGGTRRIKAVLN